jgi:hypothetical protein
VSHESHDEKHIPPEVLEQQSNPTGTARVLLSDELTYTHYDDDDFVLGERARRRLEAEIGWFEQLINHRPTIGTFYEDVLRPIVAELLPTGMHAGTGFVLDPMTRRASKQIDILIRDERRAAPYFRRGEFAIVAPEDTVAIIEVKKTLASSDVTELIESTIGTNLGTWRLGPRGFQRVHVFCYRSAISGKALKKSATRAIANYLEKFVRKQGEANKRMYALTRLALPTFYLFDRNETVEVGVRTWRR